MKAGIIGMLAAGILAAAPAAHGAVILMSGAFAAEAPGATGSGTLLLAYDDVAHTLQIDATFAGLSGATNNAHIHCCLAAPMTGTAPIALATGGILPGFPLGITAGTYSRLIDLAASANYNAAFVTASGGTVAGAEARLIGNLLSRQAYFNIHTTTFPGGEIRAFVTRVPEPGTLALLGIGLLALHLGRRRAAV